MLAPQDRKRVSFGQVASVWPAMGSPLVLDGKLYATAGHGTEYDGGIVVAVLDPATGNRTAAKQIGPGPMRQNDVLSADKGKIQLQGHLSIDPQTLNSEFPSGFSEAADLEGFKDSSWTRLGSRRSGLILKGFLWLVSTKDKAKKAECEFNSPPTCNGLAVTGGRIYVSLLNGEVVCLGK